MKTTLNLLVGLLCLTLLSAKAPSRTRIKRVTPNDVAPSPSPTPSPTPTPTPAPEGPPSVILKLEWDFDRKQSGLTFDGMRLDMGPAPGVYVAHFDLDAGADSPNLQKILVNHWDTYYLLTAHFTYPDPAQATAHVAVATAIAAATVLHGPHGVPVVLNTGTKSVTSSSDEFHYDLHTLASPTPTPTPTP